MTLEDSHSLTHSVYGWSAETYEGQTLPMDVKMQKAQSLQHSVCGFSVGVEYEGQILPMAVKTQRAQAPKHCVNECDSDLSLHQPTCQL